MSILIYGKKVITIKKWLNRSIGRRLFVSAVALSVIPLGVMAYILDQRLSEELKANIDNKLNKSVEVANFYFNDKAEEALSLTEKYSKEPTLITGIKSNERATLEKNLKTTFDTLNTTIGITVFEIGDSKGVVLSRLHNTSKFGDNKSKDEAIRSAIKGTPVKGLEFGASGLAVRAFSPVKDGNNIIGTLQMGFNFNEKLLGDIHAITNAEVSIFEKDKLILTSNRDEKDLIGKQISDGSIYDRVTKGEHVVISNDSHQTIYYPLWNPSKTTIQGMIKVSEDTTAITKKTQDNRTMMLVICIITGILSLLLSFLMSKRIIKPINEVTIKLEEVGNNEGDLTSRLDVKSQDELGRLSLAFNMTMDNIHRIVSEINNTTLETTNIAGTLTNESNHAIHASNNIREQLLHISEGIEIQSHDSEKTSIAISEINENTKRILTNSENALTTSNRATTEAEKGQRSIVQISNQMDSIQATSNESSEAIEFLNKKSDEIGNIIKIITGISEQTNLLALNAAIEAARAGEQGKGFAVVSEEIRKLAELSSTSSKQIAEIIKDIQAKTTIASSKMKTGSQEIEKGKLIVTDAGSAFEKIVSDIREVQNQINVVVDEVNELSASTDDITQIIKGNDALMKENVTFVENVSESTEKQMKIMTSVQVITNKLNEISRESEDLISKFKI